MSERVARRRISFLLATTFIISTAPGGIGAMAKDETPPATSDADAKSKPISPAARGTNAQGQTIQLDTITVQSKKRTRTRTAFAKSGSVVQTIAARKGDCTPVIPGS